MNAVIMAGGYGNRLKPLTDALPKPMLNICNRPMIDYCVAQLAYYGIRDVVFSLGYRPEKIIEWSIGYTDIKTGFSVEDMPLGTLGGVKAASEKLSDVFVVISGDGLNDIDLNAMINRHLDLKAEVTIAVKEMEDPSLYGVADLGADGFIKGFKEKPHDIKDSAFINCGTYIVNKSTLKLLQRDNCDFAKDLFPLLLERGNLGYYKHRGYWCDIGDFASYYNANFDMANNSFFSRIRNIYDEDYKSNFVGNLEKSKDDLSEASLVSATAAVQGYLFKSIVGHGSIVSADSSLSHCIVMDGARVSGRHCGCILGTNGVRIDILGGQEVTKSGESSRGIKLDF